MYDQQILNEFFMGPIGLESLELFALELGKNTEVDYIYTVTPTNINQLAPNLVKMYMTVRSQMSSIIGQIRQDWSVLSALELENCNI